jgi:hypothetical protein
MAKQDEHRWAVDGIEEETARVEEDGSRMMNVPRRLLPSGAKEGDVLRVTRTEDKSGSVQITITVDAEATRDALAASKASVTRTMAASKKRDPGGNVSL